jgi:16S rRNA (cytidine1402-2'-O)-methyltransferase
MKTGILYLVATPIGNLEDMTYRAVRILQEADLIAAEDTRNSIKLLNHFEIQTPMTSYHEFNKYDKAEVLIQKLLAGESIALITDAGTPGISDPGEVLVEKCYQAGVTVVPVPGACAAVNALIASGQPTRRFAFEAFLPAEKKERKEILTSLAQETRTIVLYEAPHRLKKTLEELLDALGDRELTVCKELTKKHETFLKTTIEQAVSYFAENEPRGEYVLIIKGKSMAELKEEQAADWEKYTIEEHLRLYMEDGFSKKEAIKKVAQDRNVAKRDIYRQAMELDLE